MGGIMGGGGGDGPDPPDYMALSQQQHELDRQNANEITRANRPDQYDALGNSITWTQGPDGSWQQHQNYTPEVLQQFTGQVANANRANDIYGGLLNRMGNQQPFQGPDMPTFDVSNGDAVANSMYESAMSRLRPEQQREQQNEIARMRLQGLDPRSEAYDAQRNRTLLSQGDVNAKLALDSVGAGYKTALDMYGAQLRGQSQDWGQRYKEYNLPWEQAGKAAQLAGDRYIPSMPGFAAATGYNAQDVIGAANADYNARMANNNSQNDKMGGMFGAGMDVVGGFM